MSDEIYEVSRDEFKGFMDQIRPECFIYKEYGYGYDSYDSTREIKIYSADETRHFASIKSIDGNPKYYVYEMPHDDERRAPKRIMKVTLETQEEVQDFFNALNTLQNRGDKDD